MIKPRVWLPLACGLAWVFTSTLQAQYLAPRQYLRRLNPPSPPAQPPPASGLPPGPSVAPLPAVPAAAVTNTAKAKAERDAATRRAVEFQRKRAEGGSATAQYGLGIRYLSGDGVEVNLAEARKWLGAAAQQDHVWAKKKLAELDAQSGPATNTRPATAKPPEAPEPAPPAIDGPPAGPRPGAPTASAPET